MFLDPTLRADTRSDDGSLSPCDDCGGTAVGMACSVSGPMLPYCADHMPDIPGIRAQAARIKELAERLAEAELLLDKARPCVSACPDHGVMAGAMSQRLDDIDRFLSESTQSDYLSRAYAHPARRA